MVETIVEIPSTAELWYDLLADDNVFYAEIASPNQGADEYSYNNELCTSSDFPQVNENKIVTVDFRINNFVNENSYQLIDSKGNVVGSNTLPAANTT